MWMWCYSSYFVFQVVLFHTPLAELSMALKCALIFVLSTTKSTHANT